MNELMKEGLLSWALIHTLVGSRKKRHFDRLSQMRIGRIFTGKVCQIRTVTDSRRVHQICSNEDGEVQFVHVRVKLTTHFKRDGRDALF